MGERTKMATDRTASELAIPRLTEEVSTLSARVAKLDAELAQLVARSPRGSVAYVFAAAVLGVVLSAPFLGVGLMLMRAASGEGIDLGFFGRFREQEAWGLVSMIWLFGIALAVIAGSQIAQRRWGNENRQRVEYDAKRRHLTSERDIAVAELGRKQAELEHHRRVVAMKPGGGP
jgi:hypothetical protein